MDKIIIEEIPDENLFVETTMKYLKDFVPADFSGKELLRSEREINKCKELALKAEKKEKYKEEEKEIVPKEIIKGKMKGKKQKRDLIGTVATKNNITTKKNFKKNISKKQKRK